MPWKEKETMREEFVKRVLAREATKSALCREYGISRVTGDKWIRRYLNGESMADKSRRPFKTPCRIPEESERRIVEAREKEPALGAKKMRRILVDQGWQEAPSVSTFNAVFKRNGLITREASLAAQPIHRFEKEAPNDMWQADFKGDYALRQGGRCYPLSILDDHSRFCLNADAKENMQLAGTMDSFTRTFLEYGLPKILLCDNGVPWGSSQTTSITRFETWLMELGILPIHIRARHPQTQGKVERFNGSFKRERLAFYTPLDLQDAQRQREEYRRFYNEVRPHCALAMDVPGKHYTPSTRLYPSRIEEWEYEAGTQLRRVKSSGYLTYDGQGYYLSEGLADKTVALRPSGTDGVLDICFREFRVARLDLRNRVISCRRVYLLHNDPRTQKV